ncbi:unnamed protein product, partial [Musa textilis]
TILLSVRQGRNVAQQSPPLFLLSVHRIGENPIAITFSRPSLLRGFTFPQRVRTW